MMVSVDVPDALLAAIEAEVTKDKPQWPFAKSPAVAKTPAERKLLAEYRAAMRSYKNGKSRGAIIRSWLEERVQFKAQFAHHAVCKSCDCVCAEGGHE